MLCSILTGWTHDGADVHDMENLVSSGWAITDSPRARSSAVSRSASGHSVGAGFVHTVEPGIYFIPELIDLWKGQEEFTDFINYDKVETYKDFGGIRMRRII